MKVRSGERTPKSGIYLPDVDGAFPTLLCKHDDPMTGEAGEVSVQKIPSLGHDYIPCLWTLVERIADSGGTSGWNDGNTSTSIARHSNVPANQPCPESGWWFTPAQPGSRRYFKRGSIMPSLDGAYGQTFWQWSPDQSAPKL